MASLIKNLKFQKKIIFVCLLTSFVPVILLGYFCYHQIQSLLIERERTALADTLKQEGYALRSRLNDYESTMNHLIWNENILKLLNHSSVSHPDIHHDFRAHHVNNRLSRLLDFLVAVPLLQRFNKDYAALVHSRNEITGL